MKILLTGYTGLIGQAVLEKLSNTDDVVKIGRRQNADVSLDLSELESIAAVSFPLSQVLIHCAGVTDEDFKRSPNEAFTIAINGAREIVKKALNAGVTKLIYVSSAHVYGPLIAEIDEDCAPNPVSDYAIAHFITEQIFRRAVTSSVSVLILRPCAVFGELQDPGSFKRWSLIPFSFPKEAVSNRKIVLRSTGEQNRNYVSTNDIAETMRRWIDMDIDGARVVNPVGPLSTSVYQYAVLCSKIYEQVSGSSCEISRVQPIENQIVSSEFVYKTKFSYGVGVETPNNFIHRLTNSLYREG